MNKEFIPYEQALELKELGFDEECFGSYQLIENRDYKNGLKISLIIGLNTSNGLRNHNYKDEITNTPLYQQAFRWFREKYGLLVEVGINYRHPDRKYGSAIYYLNEVSTSERLAYEHSTYEEAELACLKKLIELAKNK